MKTFAKYHALGNDYLVLEVLESLNPPTPDQIIKICHRNYGLGSDGILYGPAKTPDADFALRIFNPDGSEAEKSGNGLRIFARYLYDRGLVREDKPFTILTPGGRVTCLVRQRGQSITVEMGRVSFRSSQIPVTGPDREVLAEPLHVAGETLTIYAATVGNPHCVIPLPNISRDLAYRLGPAIENHPNFPRRTNVQFLKVLDRSNIRIEIWERGAGYTLASGSSSSAAAAVARKIGLVEPDVTVHMPGGTIQISIADDYSITMTGPATRVGEYHMDASVLTQTLPT